MSTEQQLGERAIVIGAGMGRLMAAGVLARYFAEVLVLDKDRLPTLAEPRNSMRNLTTFVCTFMVLWTLASGTASAGLIGLSTRTESLYSINPNTGAATLVGPAGGNYNGVGLSYLGGELFASDLNLQIPPPVWNIQTAKIDPVTGISTPIGMQDGSLNWHGLASDETLGLLYSIALDQGNHPLKAMTSSGVVSTIGTGTGIDGRGMAFDDANRILYATNSDDESLYSVDVSTGMAQRIGGLGLGIDTSHNGLAYDEFNKILYLNGGVDNVSPLIGNLYSINVSTGQATLIGSNGFEFIDGLAWIAPEAVPVPEAATFALFGVGLMILCFYGQRLEAASGSAASSLGGRRSKVTA
jgi:hypothetical protein